MKGKSLPVLIVIVSAVAAFLILYGGNWYLTSRTVTKPLQTALSRVTGVTGVTVAEENGRLEVQVRLSSVADLKSTYSEIRKSIRDVSGREKYDVDVIDRRTAKLEDAYYNIHFDVQQAIATGGFSEMANTIGQKSQSLGVDRYRVFVDAEFIYVQLHQGGDYLYEIVPRGKADTAGKTASLSFSSFGF